MLETLTDLILQTVGGFLLQGTVFMFETFGLNVPLHPSRVVPCDHGVSYANSK